MRKYVILALAGVFGVAGVAETRPAAAAESLQTARSIDQVRVGALAAMQSGDFQQTQSVYERHLRRGDRRWRGNRNWRGNRGWRGARAYSGRRYYGPRRYYGRRHARPGFVIGIRP